MSSKIIAQPRTERRVYRNLIGLEKVTEICDSCVRGQVKLFCKAKTDLFGRSMVSITENGCEILVLEFRYSLEYVPRGLRLGAVADESY